MNWFKNATNLDWSDKGIYHFSNVMKFEIDSFPRLSVDKSRGELRPDKMGFYIIRDDNKEYYFSLQKNGNSIKTSITTKPLKIVGTKIYDTSQVSPQQIIEDCLVVVNNDFSEGSENGMVQTYRK